MVSPRRTSAPILALVRACAAAVEDLGYRHILAYRYLVGADGTVHTGFKGPYDIDSLFHERFVSLDSWTRSPGRS